MHALMLTFSTPICSPCLTLALSGSLSHILAHSGSVWLTLAHVNRVTRVSNGSGAVQIWYSREFGLLPPVTCTHHSSVVGHRRPVGERRHLLQQIPPTRRLWFWYKWVVGEWRHYLPIRRDSKISFFGPRGVFFRNSLVDPSKNS